MLCGAGKIDVIDSVYSDIDKSTKALIVSKFDQTVELKRFPSLQKQSCIAICTSLLHKTLIKFTQSLLHPSLVSFFERSHLSPFVISDVLTLFSTVFFYPFVCQLKAYIHTHNNDDIEYVVRYLY